MSTRHELDHYSAPPALFRFDGRTVLVTGAGRGLGAAYARAFAARGADVVVHDAGLELDGGGGDQSVADAVVAEIARAGGSAIASYDDLGDERGCLRTVECALEGFGRVDAIVHNAGLLVFEELERADRSWETVRRTSLDAPFHITRAAWPTMKEQGYGRFVFTTSGRAMRLKDSVAGLSAYNAGKMGAFGLMLVVAAEGAVHGIRANAISPVAATRMLQRDAKPGELAPELVAPAVLYLASDRCRVSGIVLRAAGGKFGTVAWQDGNEIDLGALRPKRSRKAGTRSKESHRRDEGAIYGAFLEAVRRTRPSSRAHPHTARPRAADTSRRQLGPSSRRHPSRSARRPRIQPRGMKPS